MILDYRTVSTVHAKITYANGRFYLSDNRSSNGTLVYLQDPLPLSFSQPVKIRMGRTTLSLQAKRSWSSALRAFVFGSSSTGDDSIQTEQLTQTLGATQTVVHSTSIDYSGYEAPTPNDLQALIATLTSTLADKEAAANNGLNAADADTGAVGGSTQVFLNRSYTARTFNDHDHENDVGGDNDNDNDDIYGASGGIGRNGRMMLEHGYIPPNDMMLTAGQQQQRQDGLNNNAAGSNRMSPTTRFVMDDELMIMPRERHEDVDDEHDLDIHSSNSPLNRPYRIDQSSMDTEEMMMAHHVDTRSEEELLRDVLALSNLEFQQHQQLQQQQLQQQLQSAKASPQRLVGGESPRPEHQSQQLSRNGSQILLNSAIQRAQTPPALALGLLSSNGNGERQVLLLCVVCFLEI